MILGYIYRLLCQNAKMLLKLRDTEIANLKQKKPEKLVRSLSPSPSLFSVLDYVENHVLSPPRIQRSRCARRFVC